MNRLQELHEAGVSIWLDVIRRGLLTSGEFARLIAEDAVTGVTSNPTIFEKAIAGSTDYDAAIREAMGRRRRRRDGAVLRPRPGGHPAGGGHAPAGVRCERRAGRVRFVRGHAGAGP